MAQDFCNKYKKWIHALAKQRLFLIRTNKCGGDVDKRRYNAEVIIQRIESIFSDAGMADFILKNSDKIDSLISHSKVKRFVKDNQMLSSAINEAKFCVTVKNLTK